MMTQILRPSDMKLSPKAQKEFDELKKKLKINEIEDDIRC